MGTFAIGDQTEEFGLHPGKFCCIVDPYVLSMVWWIKSPVTSSRTTSLGPLPQKFCPHCQPQHSPYTWKVCEVQFLFGPGRCLPWLHLLRLPDNTASDTCKDSGHR